MLSVALKGYVKRREILICTHLAAMSFKLFAGRGDSVVVSVTWLRAGLAPGMGKRFPLSRKVQTGSSTLMLSGYRERYSQGYSDGRVMLVTRIHPVPKLKLSGAVLSWRA
jgi:hypothetical protein